MITKEHEEMIVTEAYKRFPVIDNGNGDANEKDRNAFIQELINDLEKLKKEQNLKP